MGRSPAHSPASPLLTAALLAAALTAASVTLALTVFAPGGGGPGPPATPIAVSTSITPRQHFFGDRLSARVTVRVQPGFVDPRTVAIDASFAPYTTLARPRLQRTNDGVVLDARLACLARACAPRGPQRARELAPVLVRFRERGRQFALLGRWPTVLVASRLTLQDLARPTLRIRAQPPASPGIDRAAGWALAGVAALLFLAAGLPAARRLFRSAETLGGSRSRLGELERALADVRRLANEGDEARRSALDRLAAALARSGLQGAVSQARSLAWSKRPPSREPMRRLLQDIERLKGST